MGTAFQFGILAQGLSLTRIGVADFALASLPSVRSSHLMPCGISSKSDDGIPFGIGAIEPAMRKVALVVFQGFFRHFSY